MKQASPVEGEPQLPSPLETVFLDAGGVLVDPNWQLVSEALARHGINIAAEALCGAETHAKRDLDQRALVARSDDEGRGKDFFYLVLERLGVGASDATAAALSEVRAHHRRANLWDAPVEGVHEALDALRRAGLRLVVVSNANGTLQALFERLRLASYFDLLLDSAVEKIEKPDPRLFQRALERSGAKAPSTVHVGDLYEIDVVGARRAGVAGVLIDRGDLYPEADCPRFPSLRAFTDAVLSQRDGH